MREWPKDLCVTNDRPSSGLRSSTDRGPCDVLTLDKIL